MMTFFDKARAAFGAGDYLQALALYEQAIDLQPALAAAYQFNLKCTRDKLKKLEEELKYTQGFLNSVVKKLSNERFVAGAPEAVVALEKAKQADAEAKIKVLEERIAAMK